LKKEVLKKKMKHRQYKKGTVYLNSQNCSICGSFMIQQIKPDLSGKEWVCLVCKKGGKE